MLIRTSQFGRLSALFLALGMSFAAMAAELTARLAEEPRQIEAYARQ